jgi:DNA-binding GntR family transcriptional regulator
MDQLAKVGFTSLYSRYPNPNYRINFPADTPTVSYRQQTLHRARILDHFPIRKALEPVVFELAASRMTPARIAKAMAMREGLQTRVNESSQRLDENALVRRVAGWSGNRLASDLVAILWKMEGYAYAAIKARAEAPAELHRTRREYIEILDRLICGDGQSARSLVEARLERLDHLYFDHIPRP